MLTGYPSGQRPVSAIFLLYVLVGGAQKRGMRLPPKSRGIAWAETVPNAKMQKERNMRKKKRFDEYTQEFKESAVRRTRMPNRTVASVAEELDIPAWRLSNWIRDSKQKLERSSELDELLKAHNRIKELEEQVEILKKAAAYFAKNLW